jgi:hypothetical protein
MAGVLLMFDHELSHQNWARGGGARSSSGATRVRRFAQGRRRAAASATVREAMPKPMAKAGEGPDALLADLDDERRDIAIQFSQALRQAGDPDMLARGRRVALNFADAVARRVRDAALRDEGRD